MKTSAFPKFPKTTRVTKDVVLTEKIDGTNGLIYVQDANTEDARVMPGYDSFVSTWHGDYFIRAGSRNRWLKPGKESDNYGFASFVREHAEDLAGLRPGLHYGEWFGKGINRGYGLEEKRFALFNAGRFYDPKAPYTDPQTIDYGYGERPCPDSLTVVPVLAVTTFASVSRYLDIVCDTMPGAFSFLNMDFARPEGVMVYDTATKVYKKCIFGSTSPKSLESVK
ncbi:RNA ligase family protein [Streptomyces smyrnaeus]|uniref:RNA ligase family protein n=1 Tax=Streptomyces smyrnaeus TaxID=1387713 RepID=UPI0036C56CBF